ncbi:MAG: transcription termination factor NusA [Oscillospiraceae bacterium]|nr:transcription termination factor NusA [Oscillospiraceae bacterium]
MDNAFFEALDMLGSENGLDTATLIEKIKSAMLKAARKAYPDSEDNITVEIDPVTKKFEMYLRQEVIEDEPIDENEVNIAEARTMDPNAKVGDYIQKRLDISRFGRAAALSAKQSIKGDLRDINRQRILDKFQDKENDCITCTVTQVEKGGAATLVYDKTEIYLFHNEQIPGEELKEGQSIMVYVTNIANKQKKPIIKISRVRKELVKRMFELEVPEIYDGVVEIKAISREAGARTKIAVWSNDPNVDPVSACIGPKHARIDAVVKSLSGEKIDIIPYSEKPEEFIARALAPAAVEQVTIINPEERLCGVLVPANQLSLAIGNRGQNAKLAAKLTGYKIDIKAATPENAALIAEKLAEANAELAAKAAAEEAAAAAAEAQAAQDAQQEEDAAAWEDNWKQLDDEEEADLLLEEEDATAAIEAAIAPTLEDLDTASAASEEAAASESAEE